MNFSIAVVILAFLGSVSAGETQIRAFGKLTCDMNHTWCIRMKLVERNFLADDTIGTFGGICFDGASVEPYELKGTEYGDRFDSTYMIQMVVSHNCSFHGLIRTFMNKPRTVSTSETKYEFESNYVLSAGGGLGTRVKNFDAAF